MVRRVLAVGGAVAVVAAGAVAVLVIGVRTRSPRVVDAVRRLARDVGNPRVLATAGQVGATASVLEHVGRRSGMAYRTPVTAVVTGDGFVIALPYGPDTDWLKNLTTAGRATLRHGGGTYAVDQPAVVPLAEALGDFPSGARRALRWFGVQECVRLRHAPDQAADVGDR
jgi:deazaflavin-dependent oxidoreductase (nitroreductase family)